MEAANQYSKLGFPVAPTLFMEFSGTPQGVCEQTEMASMLRSILAIGHPMLSMPLLKFTVAFYGCAFSELISKENGGSDFIFEKEAEDRARLWRARHQWYYAGLALRPGKKVCFSVFVFL